MRGELDRQSPCMRRQFRDQGAENAKGLCIESQPLPDGEVMARDVVLGWQEQDGLSLSGTIAD